MGSPLVDARELARDPNPEAEPAPAATTLHRVRDRILVVIVVLGAVLRIRQYAYGRSLWFDELMIASNVRDRSFLDLTRQLSFSQAAPIGFLWAAKASIVAFGQSELGYRLVPVLAGMATVAFVALAARRILGAPAAIAATATIAIAGQSIHYSSEFKQYSMEAAVAAALLLVSSYCLGRRLSDAPRHPVLLAASGALAMTCSISAVFVLAGTGLVLVIQTVRSRRREHYLDAAKVTLTWAAAAAVMYAVSWSKDARNDKLHDYWQQYFGPAPWAHPTWYLNAWSEMIRSQVAVSWYWLALALTVGGMLWLARRAPTIAVVTVVTVLSTVVASWLGVYPFDGRLLLFLVPTVCLFFGAVVDAVATLLPRIRLLPRTLVAAACALALVSGSVNSAWATAVHPYQSEEMRQLLQTLRPQVRPGDRVFVADSASLAFGFYEDRTRFRNVPAVIESPAADYQDVLDQINALGPGVTWVVFARVHPGTPEGKEARYIPPHVNGHVVRTIRKKGVKAVEIEQTA